MNRRKNKRQTHKLNLIPILDAVFIFIFFLLLSAQFVNTKIIGSDFPSTAEITKQDKKPLNLILKVTKKMIIVKKGMSEITVKSFNLERIEELNTLLEKIKKEHPNEKSIVVRPDSGINYKSIVKIIDGVREGMTSKEELFPNVIFERA